ncbi:RNA polymerase subunit sigma-24 [Paenibacillus xanthanilyticus]|uniref:RNA polymerase subunit sigma-24 n=1 Tax=Paenibacillus xanthanilyticus TaxID=1783531 RepID=A0ABV8KB47_9BACL
MRDKRAIEQLSSYKTTVARMKILEKYPVGSGIYLGALSRDDHVQELQIRLRKLPSHTCMSKQEQQLETVAHAYPAGTQNRLGEARGARRGDEEDELLRELRGRMEQIIEARAGKLDNFEAVIERLGELQDLARRKKQIEWALDVLEEFKPEYGRLLRLQYMENKTAVAIAMELRIAERTYRRWKQEALTLYGKFMAV